MTLPYKASILPSKYFHDYLQRAITRWPTFSAAIHTLQAGGLLPGVYPEILAAYTAAAGQHDNTCEATTGLGARVAFAELGLYQISAGSADRDADGRAHGPWPKTTPSNQPNDWLKLHADPEVVKALGRNATMAPNAWRGAIDDQHAIGLAALRDYYASVRRKLADNLKPSSPATSWGSWLMMMAFSAGGGGAAAAANLFGAQLAAIDEKHRPAAHVHLAARAISGGRWHRTGGQGLHSNPAHRLLRTLQKFRFAEEIAKSVNDPKAADFFSFAMLGDQRAAHEDAIAREDQLLPKSSTTIQPITFPAS
jgi:hypothetical protein